MVAVMECEGGVENHQKIPRLTYIWRGFAIVCRMVRVAGVNDVRRYMYCHVVECI